MKKLGISVRNSLHEVAGCLLRLVMWPTEKLWALVDEYYQGTVGCQISWGIVAVLRCWFVVVVNVCCDMFVFLYTLVQLILAGSQVNSCAPEKSVELFSVTFPFLWVVYAQIDNVCAC
jgi:hypothetical protein